MIMIMSGLQGERSQKLIRIPDFYRATICVSADFAVARCLSVRLSRWCMYCIHKAENIVKLLSRSDSNHSIVILTPGADTQSQGDLFSEGAKYTGWENLRFSTEIAVILGNGRPTR